MPTHLILLVILTFTVFQPDETVRRYGGADRVWHVQSIDGKPYSAEATLTFPSRNRIEGAAPCNRYFSTNTTAYPWIEIGPIAATRRACPDLAAEQQFFDALQRANIVVIDGDLMTFSDETSDILVFSAAD